MWEFANKHPYISLFGLSLVVDGVVRIVQSIIVATATVKQTDMIIESANCGKEPEEKATEELTNNEPSGDIQ